MQVERLEMEVTIQCNGGHVGIGSMINRFVYGKFGAFKFYLINFSLKVGSFLSASPPSGWTGMISLR